jgi:ubiquitin-conjugating enzyme E2 variant
LSTTEENDNTAVKKSWEEDGFVFGLEGSGLQRPKGRVANVVVEGDSLETKPYQVAIVTGTMAAHAVFAMHSFHGMLSHHGNVGLTALHALIMAVSSWLLADFGSGVLHWSVDNYGNGRTPIMGSIIAAFQGHHSAPWTITERGFCNNVYKLCMPFGILPMLLINAIAGPATTFFFTIFCVLEILSQEFHKWSHQLKSETPAFANWLQKYGLTIARTPHALHHMAPFDGNYCIISGACNRFLDESGFFRRLEHFIYRINGVESNAWKLDPALRERTLAGNYRLPFRN